MVTASNSGCVSRIARRLSHSRRPRPFSLSLGCVSSCPFGSPPLRFLHANTSSATCGKPHSAVEPNQEPNFEPSDEKLPPPLIRTSLRAQSQPATTLLSIPWQRRGKTSFLWRRRRRATPLRHRRGTRFGQRRVSTLVCRTFPSLTRTPCRQWNGLVWDLPSATSLIANQVSTRRACKKADAVDAHRVKTRKEAEFHAQVAASTATNNGCRSAEESKSTKVAHLEALVSASSIFSQLAVRCSTSLS